MTEDLRHALRRHRADVDPVDVQGLVEAGLRRRRRRHGLLAAGVVVAAAVVVGLVLLPVVRPSPVPDIVDDPSPGREPTTAPTTEALPVVTATDLGVDVLRPVDGAGGDDGHVVVDRADGTTATLPVETPSPTRVRVVPDGGGGVVWQPFAGAGGSPPVLRVDPEGTVTEVVPPTTSMDETHTLVGAGEGEVLVERRRGIASEDATVDLVAHRLDDGAVREVASVPTDGTVRSAAAVEATAYVQAFEEVSQVVVAWPDRVPTVAHEGDALEGRAVLGVAMADAGTAVALVGFDDPELVQIDTQDASTVSSVQVPLDRGGRAGEVTEMEVAAHGRWVLVNRRAGQEWLAPLVYDVEEARWAVLDTPGRTMLAPGTSAPAEDPPCAEHTDRRDAAPRDDVLDMYLVCLDEGGDLWESVFRHDSEVSPTGDVATDARAVLEEVLDGAPDELADDGYSGLARSTGQGEIGVRDVQLQDGTLVVDFAFPDTGLGTYSTSAGSMVWHQLVVANLLQFDAVEQLELRANGTCDYGSFFEGEGCFTYDQADAPWSQ